MPTEDYEKMLDLFHARVGEVTRCFPNRSVVLHNNIQKDDKLGQLVMCKASCLQERAEFCRIVGHEKSNENKFLN